MRIFNEAQLKAAVHMFFEGGHPVPMYTLANAVREIVGKIGELIDVETTHRILAAKNNEAAATARANLPATTTAESLAILPEKL